MAQPAVLPGVGAGGGGGNGNNAWFGRSNFATPLRQPQPQPRHQGGFVPSSGGGRTPAAAAASDLPPRDSSSESVPAAMVRLLLTFARDADDAGGGTASAGGSSSPAGAATATGGAADVYESFADTPTRRRRLYLTRHSRLMSELGRMALAAAVTDDLDGRDARFLVWVGTLLRDAGGSSGDGMMDGDGVDGGGGGGRRRRTCGEVLDRVALSVEQVLRAAASDAAAATDGPIDGTVRAEEGGGEEEAALRGAAAVGTAGAGLMLSLLLPSRGGDDDNLQTLLAELGSMTADGGSGGDADESTTLALLLRVPSLLETLRRDRSGSGTDGTGDGRRDAKRRRRYNSGGHGSTSDGASGGGFGSGGDGGDGTARASILLGYVVAHYYATSSAETTNEEEEEVPTPAAASASASASSSVTSWEYVKSSTLVAASAALGWTHRLGYVRAGLACYGLDAMGRCSALIESSQMDHEGRGDEGRGQGEGGEGGAEDGIIVEEGASNVVGPDGDGLMVCRCDGTGNAGVAIDGLSPKILVNFILEDSAVIPTLHKISGLPHRRELVARIADVLLKYDYYLHAAAADLSGGDDDKCNVNNDGVGAVLDLIRRGNRESPETYLRFLGGRNGASAAANAIGAIARGGGTLVGSKRKRGMEGRLLRPNDDDGHFLPLSVPSARPILTEMEANLCRSDIDTAVRLCQRLDASPGAEVEVKREGWRILLDFLREQGMLFDDGNDDDYDVDYDSGYIANGNNRSNTRVFQLLQAGKVGLAAVKVYMRNLVVEAVGAAEEAGREASAASSSHRDADAAAEAVRYAREAEDYARYTQLRVRRAMLRFLLSRNNEPTVALAVADDISCLGTGRGGIGGRSYLGIAAGGGHGQGDPQILRRIEGILSGRSHEHMLDFLTTATTSTPYPLSQRRLGAVVEGEAPLAAGPGGDGKRDESVDLSAAEDGMQRTEATAAIAEQVRERTHEVQQEQPVEEGPGASAIVLLDDDDDEEDEEYVEEEEVEEEDVEAIEQASDAEAHAEDEESEDAALHPGGEMAGSDATADKEDIVEILDSSTSEDEVGEEESVDQDELEEHAAAGQDEGAVDGEDDAEEVEVASSGEESVEEDRRRVVVAADQVGEDVVMSDDMDEADEATAEYDDEEERSAREALHDSDSDVEEVAVEAETREADNADAIDTAPTVRIVDAEPESVLVQAAMSSQRQHSAGRRASDFSSGVERRGDEYYDDTTCAVAGTDADLSEYYTETSQGTHDSGAEFETEPPRVEQPPPPRHQAEGAQPGSLLIAAAISSQRGSQSSSGDESGRTGEDYHDDTTAAVVGTGENLDECFTDAGSQTSQASQRGDDSVGGDAAASEDMGGASQEGITSAEVSLLEGLLEGYEEVDQEAGEENIPGGDEEGAPLPHVPPPVEGFQGQVQEEENSEPMAVESHQVEEAASEASIADDNASMANTSMVVHPTDSPKGSIILETSEAEAEEIRNVESEPTMKAAGKDAEAIVNSVREQWLSEMQKSADEDDERQEEAEDEYLQGSKEGRALTLQDLDDFSYKELQHECKDRGLTATGKSEDLKQRLMPFVQGEVEGPIDSAADKDARAGKVDSGEPIAAASTTASASLMAPLGLVTNALLGIISPKPKIVKKEEIEQEGEGGENENEKDVEKEEIEQNHNEGVGGEDGDKGDAIDGLDKLSFHQLRHKCKTLGLPATGKTEDLKERLLEFFRDEKAVGESAGAKVQSKEADDVEKQGSREEQAEEDSSEEDNKDALSAANVDSDNAVAEAVSTASGMVFPSPLGLAKKAAAYLSPKSPGTAEPMGGSDKDSKVQEQEDVGGKDDEGAQQDRAKAQESESESLASQDIDELSYHELQHELKIRHKPAIGKMDDLRQRLLESVREGKDVNDNGASPKDGEAPTDSTDGDMQVEETDGAKAREAAAEDKEGNSGQGVGRISTATDKALLKSPLERAKEAVFGLLSAKKKDPEIIEIDDSDQGSTTGGIDVKQEDDADDAQQQKSEPLEDDYSFTREDVEVMPYRVLQANCEIRNLRATGKTEELRARLLDFLPNAEAEGDLKAAPQEAPDNKAPEGSTEVEDEGNQQQSMDISMGQAAPTASASAQGGEERKEEEVKDSNTAAVQKIAASQEGASGQAAAKASSAATDTVPMSSLGRMKEAVIGFLSPKKKDPEIIEIGDSDEESLGEVNNVKQEEGNNVKQEEDAGAANEESAVKEEEPQEEDGDDDDFGLSIQDVDGLSYHELQHELKTRKLRATGKKDDLRDRLKDDIKERNADIPTSVLKVAHAQSPMSSIASTPDYSVASRASRGRARLTPSSAADGEQTAVHKKLMPVKEETEVDGASVDEGQDAVAELPSKATKARAENVSSVASSRKSSQREKTKQKDADDDGEGGSDDGASHASSVTTRRRGQKAQQRKGSSSVSASSRQSVRRKKEDAEGSDEGASTRPSPRKRRKRNAGASPASTLSRVTRNSAASGRSTRSSTRGRASTAPRMLKRLQD